MAAALSLAEIGPGPLSLEALRGRERAGTLWALAALAAGGAGALGVIVWTSRYQGQQPAAEPGEKARMPATAPGHGDVFRAVTPQPNATPPPLREPVVTG
jgi:hypothetical protein